MTFQNLDVKKSKNIQRLRTIKEEQCKSCFLCFTPKPSNALDLKIKV